MGRWGRMKSLIFRMQVIQLKCIGCDLNFLVEKFRHHTSKQYHCPNCRSRILVHKIKDRYIAEEE